MTRKRESTGEKIYSGTATVGRLTAVVGAVMGTLVGLVLITVGIVMIVHHTKLTSEVLGTVKNPNCSSAFINDNKVAYNCTFEVAYTVEEKPYTKEITLDDSPRVYSAGDSVTVYYDPKDPSNASTNSDNTKVPGIIFLVIGIIVPIGAWLWWYFAHRYKAVAAAGGVAAGLDLLSGGRTGAFL